MIEFKWIIFVGQSPQTPHSSGESVHDQAEIEDEVKLKVCI